MIPLYIGVAACVVLSIVIIHSLAGVQKTMSDTNVELLALVAALDAETNAVSARLDKDASDLAAALANGQAPLPSTLASLQAISDRLKSLGANPAAPIPAPVAPPAAPTAPAAS